MINNQRGGKREGAGRPKGSVNIPDDVRDLFRQHTEQAVESLISIASDTQHPQQIKALQMILERGWGTPKATNDGEPIIRDYLAGIITAEQAGLLLESKGITTGKRLNSRIVSEMSDFF